MHDTRYGARNMSVQIELYSLPRRGLEDEAINHLQPGTALSYIRNEKNAKKLSVKPNIKMTLNNVSEKCRINSQKRHF